MFPTNSECLIGISDAFSAFCLRVSVIYPTCSLYPQQKRAYSALHPHAYTGHACRHLPSAVPWISKDRLLGPLPHHHPAPSPRPLLPPRPQPAKKWTKLTTCGCSLQVITARRLSFKIPHWAAVTQTVQESQWCRARVYSLSKAKVKDDQAWSPNRSVTITC